MKFTLLTSASTLALGTAFALVAPGTAEAGLTCTRLSATTSSCTEIVTTQLSQVGTTTMPQATVNVDYANPAVFGKLTSVVASETLTWGSSVGTLKNKVAHINPGNFAGGIDVTVVAGTSPSNFPTGLYAPLQAKSSAFTLAAGGSASYTGTAPDTQTYSTGSTAILDTSPYATTDTFSVTYNIVDGASSPATFDYSGVTTFAEGTISITYGYFLPEPASLAVLGTGLTGLGVLRRRRKR